MAAMALNRIIDRKIDKRNPRTTDRELPSGKMTLSEATLVLALGSFLYFSAAAVISTFCLILSPIPLLVFMGYPYMKRFTRLAHFGVGLGLAMAPLGGWFAVRHSFEDILPGLLLSGFTLFWVTGFDIIYSTLDEEFDRKENLYSLPAVLGSGKALRISALLHFLAFISLILLFILQVKAIAALPFLFITGLMLYLEHRNAQDVELAFFKINAVLGFCVLAMVITGVYFR